MMPWLGENSCQAAPHQGLKTGLGNLYACISAFNVDYVHKMRQV